MPKHEASAAQNTATTGDRTPRRPRGRVAALAASVALAGLLTACAGESAVGAAPAPAAASSAEKTPGTTATATAPASAEQATDQVAAAKQRLEKAYTSALLIRAADYGTRKAPGSEKGVAVVWLDIDTERPEQVDPAVQYDATPHSNSEKAETDIHYFGPDKVQPGMPTGYYLLIDEEAIDKLPLAPADADPPTLDIDISVGAGTETADGQQVHADRYVSTVRVNRYSPFKYGVDLINTQAQTTEFTVQPADAEPTN